MCRYNIIIIGTHEFMGMPPRFSPSGNFTIQLSYINTCLPYLIFSGMVRNLTHLKNIMPNSLLML